MAQRRGPQGDEDSEDGVSGARGGASAGDGGHPPDPQPSSGSDAGVHGEAVVGDKQGAVGLPPAAGRPGGLDPEVLRAVGLSMQRAMREALRGVNLLPSATMGRALQAVPVFPPGWHEQVQKNLGPGLSALQEQLASLSPMYDVEAFKALGAALPKIDTQGLTRALDRLREALPPNWDSLGQYEELSIIAKDDGIPVVWVPRSAVLSEMVGAPNRTCRLQVLRARQDDVLADCRTVLSQVTVAELSGRVPQALEAVAALESGLPAAAQALAVAVTEAVLTAHVANGRNYAKLAADVSVDVEDLSISELRSACALLPVSHFYTPWWSSSGTPPPDALSRHVTVHLAPASHLTVENALVAVMLLSSVLRDLQENLPGSAAAAS